MGSIAPPHAATAERFKLDGTRYVSDPSGNLMAPASARRGSIGALNFAFAARAAREKLCSVCAGAFEIDDVFVFIQSDGNEPPMHVRCAVYAAIACPYMRNAAKEAAREDGWFGFVLAASFVYERDEESGEGIFSIHDVAHVLMDYDDFVRYARPLKDNPRFMDVPGAVVGGATLHDGERQENG